MPRFSIIVPVYNCANDLPDCVGSILQQTADDWELLLVDDGATDGSGGLCDRLAKQDPRIRVFHKENGGASSARNFGLENAVGDYVLFFDGDDTVESDLLEQVSTVLGESSPQLTIFGVMFDYCSVDGGLEWTELLSMKHKGLVSLSEILSAFSEYFEDNALSGVWNKVFSGQILRDTGLRFSEKMTLYEDLDFVLRYLPHCEQIACLDHALYHYRLSVQNPNINRRVLYLDKLQRNLAPLTRSVLGLNSREATQRIADLCAQMYDLHLMTASYSRKELPRAIAAIRESAALRVLSQAGVTPSAAASTSWSMIVRDEANALFASLQKRKLVRKAKQIVKPALKAVGLSR